MCNCVIHKELTEQNDSKNRPYNASDFNKKIPYMLVACKLTFLNKTFGRRS